MSPDSGPPAHWSDAANLEFLEMLVVFSTHNGGMIPPTDTYRQWAATLSSHHAFQFRVKQLRSRYQRFRKVYHLFMGMKTASGLGWDEALQKVTCPDWKWEDYCKVRICFTKCISLVQLVNCIVYHLFVQK